MCGLSRGQTPLVNFSDVLYPSPYFYSIFNNFCFFALYIYPYTRDNWKKKHVILKQYIRYKVFYFQNIYLFTMDRVSLSYIQHYVFNCISMEVFFFNFFMAFMCTIFNVCKRKWYFIFRWSQLCGELLKIFLYYTILILLCFPIE